MAVEKLQIFETPLCLIGYGPSKSGLCVDQETLQQLQQLDRPVVVVAIAGLYKTGKSYLLNRMAGKSNGFLLGSTIQSMTKGIWILAMDHPINPDQYLLLLDTEGLGDAKKGNPDRDNWIFCLACILSSTLVYNCKCAINEDELGKLSFITEMSKNIKVNVIIDDEAYVDWYFPHLIFTVRDFPLDLEIDGKAVTANEYMEDCLKFKRPSDETTEMKERAEQFNLPRKCIREYFKNRHCFTFDRPCDKKKLEKLDQIDISELNEDFKKEVKAFLEHIYEQTPIKTLGNGTELNGRMFSSLVVTYVDAIQHGEFLCIEKAERSITEQEQKAEAERQTPLDAERPRDTKLGKQLFQEITADKVKAKEENLDRIERQKQEEMKRLDELKRLTQEEMKRLDELKRLKQEEMKRLDELKRLIQEGFDRESERIQREISDLKNGTLVVIYS